jgi:hypothetical protein
MAILVSILIALLCVLSFVIGAIWGTRFERARVIGVRLAEWARPNEAQTITANEA